MKRLLLFFLIAFFPISLWAKITVTSYGAAGRVSGSLHAVSIDSTTVLVDCGGFIEEENETPADGESNIPAPENGTIPAPALHASAVILTHAHLDHSGRLPLLADKGWRGVIYCSSYTATITRELLIMDARYAKVSRRWSYTRRSNKKRSGKGIVTGHWRTDCLWRGRIKASNIQSVTGTADEAGKKQNIIIIPCAKCAELDRAKLFQRFFICKLGKPYSITRAISFTLYDSGHIPGAAYVVIAANHSGRKDALLFYFKKSNFIGKI
jgi:metallo-beta-lactamase family protein